MLIKPSRQNLKKGYVVLGVLHFGFFLRLHLLNADPFYLSASVNMCPTSTIIRVGLYTYVQGIEKIAVSGFEFQYDLDP